MSFAASLPTVLIMEESLIATVPKIMVIPQHTRACQYSVHIYDKNKSAGTAEVRQLALPVHMLFQLLSLT